MKLSELEKRRREMLRKAGIISYIWRRRRRKLDDGGSSSSGETPLPNEVIKLASLSDSREDYESGATGPNLLDGTERDTRTSPTNTQSGMYLPWLRNDVEVAYNYGASGTECALWDSGARPNGRTFASLMASDADVVLIQFGTNDVQGNVTDAATRDTIRARVVADLQEMIDAIVAGGKKVIWQTTIQRSDSTGAVAYITNTVVKRDCVDGINSDMIAWIAANHAATDVQVADLRASLNVGGVATGAYLDTTYADDGCHLNQLGALRAATITKTALDNLFSYRGIVPMLGAVGDNMIGALSASNCGTTATGTILFNCSIAAPDFSDVTIDGTAYPAVTYTVTPSAAGFFATQILATASFAANDEIKAQVFLTVDDGSGGVSVADNVDVIHYSTFIVAAEQRIDNGNLNNNSGSLAAQAITNARVSTVARTMPAASTDVVAPTFGSGLRIMPFIYFQNGAAFRVRFVDPQIRTVA